MPTVPFPGRYAFAYGRNSVLLHLGQGGSVSVESFSTTFCPQFRQVYVPVPGFSPVVDMDTFAECVVGA